MRRLIFWMVPRDADVNPCKSLWWLRLMTLRTGACTMWLAWNMEHVWSVVGLWLCCSRKHMVLVGNDNDKNAGCSGGNGVEGVFWRSSDISPTKVAGGNGGTEQWWGGHHRRLRLSRPLIVLRKERDRARTMTETHNVFLKFSFQKHFLCFRGKTLWKSQNMSLNGFFQGEHHPVPAVCTISNRLIVSSQLQLLRLWKIQAICGRDLSQSFEIEFVQD